MSCIGKNIFSLYIDNQLVGAYSTLKKLWRVNENKFDLPHYNTLLNNSPKVKSDNYKFEIACKNESGNNVFARIEVVTVQ